MLLLIGFFVLVLIYVGLVSLFAGFFPMAAILNLPSFILIIATLTFFLIMTKSGRIIGKYFKSSFKKDYLYSIFELKELTDVIKNIIKFIIATGIVGFITFVIIALYFLDSPQHLGPNLAMSLTSITYAVAISYFVFFPVQVWAENKINELNNN